MKFICRIFIALVFFLHSSYFSFSQSLIMNEVSNGATGNQEYVEFVVVSNTVTYDCNGSTPPCIDIRGWIFDDNSGYHGVDGIATGAVRFSQDPIWSCVPLGTIILIYNGADRNTAIPPDDISMSDNNCTIIAPINDVNLFESNLTTPGAVACSYPATGWTPGGNWNYTVLANPADCARIVNLAGCEVFSLCYGTDSLNNLIYFSGTGGQTCWYFNGIDPMNQANWTRGSASPSPGDQTPGAANNPANAAYIGQFNNNCSPITPISVTATSTNSNCTCNGTATASASGSIPGYTYEWYDATFTPLGQSTATAIGLCPGTYYVIGTSHIGCPDTAMVTVTNPSVVTQSLNTSTICSGSSATLTSTPSVAGGTYAWTPGGATSQSISVSPAATTSYTCTYTFGGCSTTSSTTVTVNPVPTVLVNTATICAGGWATLTANPSSGGGTYAWTPGGSTAASISVNPSSGTTYSLTYTLGGCPATTTTTVNVNPQPTVSMNASTICDGGSATLTASPSIGGGTYLWTPGSQTTASISVNPAATTTYSVSYSLSGCSATTTNTVTVNPQPTVSINTATICNGSSATLNASASIAGGTYTWTPGGQTTASVTVNPTTTTTYSVTYSLAGCPATSTGVVTVNPQPTLSVNSSTICAGASATLNASPSISGGTYLWSPGGQTTASISVSPATGTSYSVTYSLSGCTASATSAVTVNPQPTLSVNSATICDGGTTTLSASPSLGGGTYVWNPGGQTASSISVNPTSTTTYSATYTLSGCSASATGTITVVPNPVVTVNSPTICAGQSAVLTVNGGTTYSWNSGATTNTITVTPAGTATYTVTGTTNGCSSTVTANVTVNPLPVMSVNSPTICAGQSATLTTTGATTYSWNTGSTLNPITITPATTTSYTVTGTSNGCTSSAIATVSVNPLPVVNVNSTTICNGQSTTLTATGANTYTWNTGSTSNPFTISPSSTTNYVVTGTTNGCSASATSVVTVTPLPTVAVNSATICIGSNVTLTATGAASYSWSSGSTINPITVNPSTSTSYTVTGILNGCSNTAVSTVTVNPLPVVTSTNATICNGQSATITAGGATTYSWNTGSASPSLTLSPTVTTTYTVTGTLNGCTASANGTITVNPIPTVTVNSPSICPGSGTTLIALGASTYVWSTGATGNQINVSPAVNTTYTVTGTSLGCSASAVSTVTISSALTVNAGVNDTICSGGSTILNATPSNPGSTFSWSPATGLSNTSVSNPTANPASNTVYTVTITDANGCSGSNQVTVSIDPNLSATATSLNASCAGLHNGSASAHPLGGTSPYSYSWTGGGNTANYTGLGIGTYNVIITDAIGCTTTASASVSEPASINASISNFTAASCNGSCNGNATAIASGGTGAFTYSWNTSPVQFSSTANSLCAGSYICTTTDANGCTSTTSVTITQPTGVVIAPISAVTNCAGGSTNLSAIVTGGTGTYSYVWSPATGLNSTNIANPIASPGSNTIYTLNVTDNNGCPASPQTVSVAASTQLTVTANGTGTICSGASTQLSGFASLGSGGPYTYSWSPATGLNNSSIANPIATPLVTTTYLLTVNDGCSVQTATATITVNPIPIVTVNSPSICPGSSATLIASGANTYVWSTGATTNQISVSPGSTTTYTVTGTQAGCSANATSTVTLSNILTVNAGSNDTICAGGSAVLNVSPANAGSTFTWTPSTGLNNAAIYNPTASPTGNTTYTVTVTDANGCSGSNQVTVLIDPALSASVTSANPTCFGSNNGHATLIPSGGYSPYSYNWAGGCITATNNGLGPGTFNVIITDAVGCTFSTSATISQPDPVVPVITNSYPATCNGLCDGIAIASASGGTGAFSYSWNTLVPQTNSMATALCPGIYICTATDAQGCSNTTSVTINQPNPVIIPPITSVTNCAGGSTDLSAIASGGTAPYTYNWSPATGLSNPAISNPVANPAMATTYTVTVTDDNGCPANAQTISVSASSQLSLLANGSTSICPGSSTPLSAAASLGNGGPYAYSWSPTVGLNNANIANPIASPDSTTTYTVTVNDGCSAPQQANVTINVFPSPTANLSANVTSGCAPLCVNFMNGSSVGQGGTYEWTLGNGQGTSDAQNPYHCYQSPGHYSVSLTATSADGCTGNISIPNMIEVYSLPEAAFTSTPDPLTVLNPEVTFVDLSSTDVVSWNWNFGDGGSSQEANPFHTYPAIEDQSYIVTLIVHNANGCEDTITGTIEVRPDFTFFVPNCFSPNGDGLNDTFNGKGIGISTYHMSIYDRWGLLIWETDQPGVDWDGHANGGKLMAQEDTYVWRVLLTDVFNKEHRYIGKVTLIK